MKADIEPIRKAALKLVKRLHAVHKDPNYMSVWTMFAAHGMKYEGPFYVDELAALEKALKKHLPAK